jgi:hypothetical protein
MRIALLALAVVGLLVAGALVALKPEKVVTRAKSADAIREALWDKQPYQAILDVLGPHWYIYTSGSSGVIAVGRGKGRIIRVLPPRVTKPTIVVKKRPAKP